MTRFRGRLAFAFVVVMFPIVAAASAAQDKEVVKPGAGVTLPRVIHEEKPKYTREALAAGIQGTVLLETVVLPDGTVGSVKVVRSLDKMYGLDESAITAARGWRFEPGRKDGKPVAVLVTIELTFTLRQKKENK